VSSRKERKEALRREREERERQAREAERRKRLVGYGAAGALTLGALVVVAVLLISGGGSGGASADVLPDGGEVPRRQVDELEPAARAAECVLESERGAAREHTTSLSERVQYKKNPPTSGRHFLQPTDDAAFTEAPQDEELVHSLEHGRVIIWFKPSLPEEARANLKALYDADTYQMIMVPRRDMRYAVAATAWNREPEPNGTGRLLGCRRYNERIFDALRAFRDEHRSNGPEPVP
jgi:hypothetical protein